jgi:hypothetical protein
MRTTAHWARNLLEGRTLTKYLQPIFEKITLVENMGLVLV